MMIRWDGADLWVFPREAFIMQERDLAHLLQHAFEFVPGDVAAERMVTEAMDGCLDRRVRA